jgi:hypothetical protein
MDKRTIAAVVLAGLAGAGWGEWRARQVERAIRAEVVTRRLAVIDGKGDEWIVGEPDELGAHLVIGDEDGDERLMINYERDRGPALQFFAPKDVKGLDGLNVRIDPINWGTAGGPMGFAGGFR